MRALGGGKRLRPFLVVESAALFDVPRDGALLAGCALELLHCYSLVHDDLPAMDNDDLRRGQPTVHKAFDDATAILAGDALLTFAFDVHGARRGSCRRRGAHRAGARTGARLRPRRHGRRADARSRRRRPLRRPSATSSEAEIVTLQAMKTGALIRFACDAGAILGAGRCASRARLSRAMARAIGQAFQIADDLLDVEGDSATLGKAAGKDAAAGKATLVGILGVEGARARLDRIDRGSRRRAGAVRRQRPTPCAPRRASSPSGKARASSMAAKKPPPKKPVALPVRLAQLHGKIIVAAIVGIGVAGCSSRSKCRRVTRLPDRLGCRHRASIWADLSDGGAHRRRRTSASAPPKKTKAPSPFCC